MQINKIIWDHIGTLPSGAVAIEHEELDCSEARVILFEGPNGSGKSLRVKGIRDVLTIPKKGQNFSGLLGGDATNGYVALSLNAGLKIRRDVSPIDSPLSASSKATGDLRGPRANTFVSGTFDAESVNCEAFLTKDKDKRRELILESIPFNIDRKGLSAIVGDEYDKLEGHPLEIIDHIHKKIYDGRTEINRGVKERRQMAEGLSQTIQSEVDLKVINREIEGWEAGLAALEQERNEKIERATIEQTKANSKAVGTHGETTKRLREECQAKIDALKEELSRELAGEDKIFRGITDNTDRTVESVRSEADAIFSDKSTEIKLSIQSARQQRDGEVAAEAQRKIMTDGIQAAARLEDQAKELTGKLDKLEEFKGNMLKELPIPGITMNDGEILIEGKAWDQVPDSRLVRLAFDLGIARSHESSIIIVDKAEALDDNAFENDLLPYLQKCGRQVFIGRATVNTPDGKLQIRKLEAL